MTHTNQKCWICGHDTVINACQSCRDMATKAAKYFNGERPYHSMPDDIKTFVINVCMVGALLNEKKGH